MATAAPHESVTRPHDHEYDPNSECFLCRDKRPFDFPGRLLDDALAGRLVIFAGAGISTEGPHVWRPNLFEEVATDLSLSPTTTGTFPELMSKYESAHDRPSLLQKIKRRFDYISSFPQLEYLATRFHRELATLFPITEVVTTNWDTYFEELCGATPIVAPDDYSFWNLPGRKVFKIHGSMNNIGSIVASESDYDACYERLRTGVIGASLKHMLATKTIVFVGYSFRDVDFNRIYSYLHEEMGRSLPRSIIVTLDDAFDASAYPNSTIIQTDGTFFLQEFKRRLLHDTHHFLDDERLEGIPQAVTAAIHAHEQVTSTFPAARYPAVIHTCSYQDGLIDAFQRILRRQDTGEYSHVCDVEHKIASYFELRARNLKARRYEDVAYIDGYKNGLIYLISDDDVRDALPLYFMFGAAPSTFSQFSRAIKKSARLHKAAFRRAVKLLGPIASEDLVFHHPPFFSFDP